MPVPTIGTYSSGYEFNLYKCPDQRENAYMYRKALVILSIVVPAFFFAGCNSTISSGRVTKPLTQETKRIGSQKVWISNTVSSWEILRPDGTVRLAGLTLLLNSVIDAKNPPGQLQTIALQMPPETKNTTFIDHVELQYAPQGGAPDLQQPSIAFRFYDISSNEQASIDCSSELTPEKNRIPDGYQIMNGNGCQKQIGVRMSIKYVDNPDHPTPFARVNIGFDKGNLIFFEPVVTVQQLLQRENFTLYLPTPQSTGGTTPLPTTFTAVYEPKTDSYDFSMWSFSAPSGSGSVSS